MSFSTNNKRVLHPPPLLFQAALVWVGPRRKERREICFSRSGLWNMRNDTRWNRRVLLNPLVFCFISLRPSVLIWTFSIFDSRSTAHVLVSSSLAKPLIWGQIRELTLETAVECVFPRRCSSSGSRVMRRFAKTMLKYAKFALSPDLIWPKYIRHDFCSSKCRLPSVAPWLGFKHTRPEATGAPSAGPA